MIMKRGSINSSRGRPGNYMEGQILQKPSDKPTVDGLSSSAADESLAELEDRVADVRETWETDSLFEDALEELTHEDGDEADAGMYTTCSGIASLIV